MQDDIAISYYNPKDFVKKSENKSYAINSFRICYNILRFKKDCVYDQR